MIKERYSVDLNTSYDVFIWPTQSDGKKNPIVVLIHGNFGLAKPFGDELMSLAEQTSKLGYLAVLPSYYSTQTSNVFDNNVDSHVPAIRAAIAHVSKRADADENRIGLVGFSLGGGIAMSLIQSNTLGVKVFVDFYGYVQSKLSNGVAAFPPTIIFHNKHDKVVWPNLNSEPFADALAAEGVTHEPLSPYQWYDDHWVLGGNHAFRPGGDADKNSRERSAQWIVKYLPPIGISSVGS